MRSLQARENVQVRIPLRCHIASEMLTYCHASARSCSWLIPCEDRALTIRGFPCPAPGREGCKGFWEYETDPPPAQSSRRNGDCSPHGAQIDIQSILQGLHSPQGEGSIMYCRCGHVVGCNYSLPYRGAGEGAIL